MLSHRLGLFPLRWDVRIRLSGSAQLLQQHCETSAGSPKIRSQQKPQPLRCWLEGESWAGSIVPISLAFGFVDVPSLGGGKDQSVGCSVLGRAEERGECLHFSECRGYSQNFWTKKARGDVWLLGCCSPCPHAESPAHPSLPNAIRVLGQLLGVVLP